MRESIHRFVFLLSLLVTLGNATAVVIADILTFKKNGQSHTLKGTVLSRLGDGGILLETPDTRRWVVKGDDLTLWKEKNQPVRPWSKDQLRVELKKEFGGDFFIQQMAHYVVVYNADPKLAQQAGTLLERAYTLFRAHFAQRGAFQFKELPTPLVAVIYKNRTQYLEATERELGSALSWSSGVYSPMSNRFYTYDATEGRSDRRVNLPAAGAGRSVLDAENSELIVHEGTHQLAFNFGIHVRQAENPFWFAEGLATYFESANGSAEGWQRVGNLNPKRLAHFAQVAPSLKKGFLTPLISGDKMFTASADEQIGNAYAISWALTYYLMKSKQTSYVRYVRAVVKRGVSSYGPKERLADFKSAFGTTPEGMEGDLIRYMAGLVEGLKKDAARNATAAR